MTGEPFESDGRSPEAERPDSNTGRESRSKLLKIGRYQVINQLGQGGMGIVVKASHQELDKLVAIKVLNSNLLVDETSLKRFEIEAKAGSQLSHPSLVSIFDYGVADDGSPYLVMEYIEGRSLQEILHEQGKLSGPLLVKVFEQIAKALQYIHKRGVVHRDIKASNIMLQDIEGDLYAKLVDFGIAKVIADNGSGQKLTETGSVFGSPFYMSPEQCQGNQVDARSDIYSLGCVMYECYVGNPPIQGENALKTIFMHVTHAPEPLADLNSTNPAARGFARMIHRCLEKSPNARYQNCTELLQAINEIKEAIESQKYQSPSQSSQAQPQNRWKRTNPAMTTYTPTGAQTGLPNGVQTPNGAQTGTPFGIQTGAPFGAQTGGASAGTTGTPPGTAPGGSGVPNPGTPSQAATTFEPSRSGLEASTPSPQSSGSYSTFIPSSREPSTTSSQQNSLIKPREGTADDLSKRDEDLRRLTSQMRLSDVKRDAQREKGSSTKKIICISLAALAGSIGIVCGALVLKSHIEQAARRESLETAVKTFELGPEHFSESEPLFQTALKNAQKANNPRSKAKIHNYLGKIYLHDDKPDDAMKSFDEALKLLNPDDEACRNDYLQAMVGRADSLLANHNHVDAKADDIKALKLAEKWNSDPNVKGDILLSSARIAAVNGKKPNIALSFFDRAISEYERNPTDNKDNIVVSWVESAELAQKFKWTPESVRRAQKAMELARKLASEPAREEFVRRAQALITTGKSVQQPPLAVQQTANQQETLGQQSLTQQPLSQQSTSQQSINQQHVNQANNEPRQIQGAMDLKTSDPADLARLKYENQIRQEQLEQVKRAHELTKEYTKLQQESFRNFSQTLKQQSMPANNYR